MTIDKRYILLECACYTCFVDPPVLQKWNEKELRCDSANQLLLEKLLPLLAARARRRRRRPPGAAAGRQPGAWRAPPPGAGRRRAASPPARHTPQKIFIIGVV